MSDNELVLKVRNLKKYFPVKQKEGKRNKKAMLRAVDGLNFDVKRGEILGFVGESGCGKSTMSRTILRLISPTGGKVYHCGEDIAAMSDEEMRKRRRSMQMIFQDPFGSINPRRSVSETIRMVLKIHKICDSRAEEDSVIRNILEEVGLTPVESYWDKFPAMMSGGQLQRVSMARVLVLKPEFIIADEPVSMLDVSVRIGILDLLLSMREKHNLSFIYITHDLATARYVCDRIAIMYMGRIVETGPTEEILGNPQHPYTKALIAAVPEPDPTREINELPLKDWTAEVGGEDSGCRFYPRCPVGIDSCLLKTPILTETAEGHKTACLSFDKL
ncbi:MAG: ABC transporter ATP-binding protein [Spirochaetales bacterium]|uniref:ABC transporter ATP-binding protein n=1 Tax=Candidatus Thalassospirochaeta sargassi TaxID=3119039 RepID=A0AAJ1IE39_9SPIO|nr:ABC transporter ATP-binding protein [Spirochaetales bacterium]